RTSDADEPRELEVAPAQLLAGPAAHRRMLDGRRRGVAAVNEVPRAVVVSLATRHASDEGEAVGPFGEQGEGLRDLHAFDTRSYRLEWSPLAGARFRIERIDVARTAVEPQPHATLRARVLSAGGARPEKRCQREAWETGEP